MYKHPYLIINAAGLLLVAACFAVEQIAALGFMLAFLVSLSFMLGIGLIIWLVINIVSFLAASHNKTVLAILLSLPFGSLGAILAVVFNLGFEEEEIIKIIFLIHTWIIIAAAVSYMLGESGYYSFH